jgi:N-methylhydantoinase B
VERVLIPLEQDAKYTISFDRQKASKPRGLFGGKGGSGNYVTIHRLNGSVEEHENVTGMVVRASEKLRFVMGGGGGYGNPFERNPNNVLSDVTDGYVSKKEARLSYGVVIADNLTVDKEGTESLRKSPKEGM